MAKSAGCRTAELFDEHMGMAFAMMVFYPSDAPERSEYFGPFEVSVAMNGVIAEGPFRLAVISHGTGGSHLLYRTLAAHLARNGFVVALPEHPRNNRNNNELGGTAENMENRPRHLRIAIDWAFADAQLKPELKRGQVAIIGHSLGGYTALALAGGRPVAFAHETPELKARPMEVTPDERVKALVLLAPATPWFKGHGALQAVDVPILMLTGEKDEYVTEWHANVVKWGLDERVLLEHRVVPGAGHYSFLSPYPAAMTRAEFAPSQDPPGFDRLRFHSEMNAEILAFLRRVM